ncbi:TonB-dependent receptor [Flavobacterium sp.]|uniref:TonB-dependent receptor n=1 Tax=Flavobacterium sp. TaxID=239 RepID=UPI00261B6AEE|nr:TonB-dependent receptor [Flavobacterium sp.]MDD2985360.1 TonB-dependent receptor [Flavobacterium sp.]
MKKLFLLELFLFLSNSIFAQTITLKDIQSGKPIDLVSISSQIPKAVVFTNANGQANLTNFINSEKIEIRILGYKTVINSYKEIEANHFVIYLESSNLNLEEVVISGTRWNQLSSEIPSKIVSISAVEVALINPQTAADLLSISGKVYIQKSQQGGGSPMIRGFSTNRLLYTIDGIRTNNAIFRSGNIQNVINFDPFAIENTEVLFGPGSVIYGSDAIGGVMSFQTLTPQLTLTEEALITGKAVARTSSANQERTGHFDVNLGWKKWALVSSFSSWDFDHLRQGSHGPTDYIKPYYVQRQDSLDVVITQDDPLLQIPSAYSQFNMMQKVRFKPNEKWDFQYGFHYSETSPYGRYDRHNRVKNGTARYAEWNYGPQKWMMNNLTVSNQNTGKTYDEMTIRLAQQSFEESRIDRSLNKNIRNTQTENVEAYSVNVDFKKNINSKNTLFYGVEYVLNEVESAGLETNIKTGEEEIGPSRYPKSTWQSMAGYLNNEYKMTNRFYVQTGLRYNYYALKSDFTTNLAFYPFPFEEAKLNDAALTGSIGGVYRTENAWVFTSNFGTGFRSPNVDDVGKVFDSSPGTLTVPNPDLKAEYAYNLDLGFAKVINNFIKIDVTAYYTILENALVKRNFQLNGDDFIIYDGELSQIEAVQNAAKASVYGFQAGLEIKLPAGFSFSSDLNFQKGEEELDDQSKSTLRHAAPLFGMSSLTYKAEKLNLQFYTNYQAERKFEDLPFEEQLKDEIYAKDSNGNNFAPSWYTLNLKSMYALTEKLSLSAGVENLTDQRYRPYSSGISGAGRNFVLSLRADF